MTERVPSPHTVSPAPSEGESTDAWSTRLIKEGAALGVNRQCSIGYHYECSDRREGADAECRCACHGEEGGETLWKAGEVSAVVYGDTLDLENEDYSLVTLTKEEAEGLAAVLIQWARS